MLYLAKDQRKQAYTALENKDFATALILFRQMRGYTQNYLQSKHEKQKLATGYSYHAEATLGIVHCILEIGAKAYDQNKDSQAYLAEIEKAKLEIADAEAAIKSAQDQLQHVIPRHRESMQASLAEIIQYKIEYQQVIDKALMTIDWNKAVDILESINPRVLPESIDQRKEIELRIQSAVHHLEKSLNFATNAQSTPDATDIRETLVELYENSGDLFASYEKNENIYKFRMACLNFMLQQYGQAFHQLRADPTADTMEMLNMHVSVLNTLEQLANLAAIGRSKGNSDVIRACVETIRFIKKFPPSMFDGTISPEDRVEIQSYQFTAHHLLSKHYTDPTIKAAHKNRAVTEAQELSRLSEFAKLEQTEPLYDDLINARYFICKRILKNCFAEIARDPSFNQNAIAAFAIPLGNIHRNSKGKLHLFFKQVSHGQRNASLVLSFNLFSQANMYATHPKLDTISQENIDFLWAQHKPLYSDLVHWNPTEGAQNKIVGKSIIEYQQILRKAINDYLSELEVYFTKSQIIEAFPAILQEIMQFMQDTAQPAIWIDIIQRHLNDNQAILTRPLQSTTPSPTSASSDEHEVGLVAAPTPIRIKTVEKRGFEQPHPVPTAAGSPGPSTAAARIKKVRFNTGD